MNTDDKESAANNSSNKIAHLRPCMGVLGERKKEEKTLDAAVIVETDPPP